MASDFSIPALEARKGSEFWKKIIPLPESYIYYINDEIWGQKKNIFRYVSSNKTSLPWNHSQGATRECALPQNRKTKVTGNKSIQWIREAEGCSVIDRDSGMTARHEGQTFPIRLGQNSHGEVSWGIPNLMYLNVLTRSGQLVTSVDFI